jgi:hypothetical protein
VVLVIVVVASAVVPDAGRVFQVIVFSPHVAFDTG